MSEHVFTINFSQNTLEIITEVQNGVETCKPYNKQTLLAVVGVKDQSLLEIADSCDIISFDFVDNSITFNKAEDEEVTNGSNPYKLQTSYKYKIPNLKDNYNDFLVAIDYEEINLNPDAAEFMKKLQNSLGL